MMKKLSAVLAVILCLLLCACGEDTVSGSDSANPPVGVSDTDALQGDAQYKDGDRYTVTISIEGMQETVNCQYKYGNGYRMGYFCDDFAYSVSDGEDLFKWKKDNRIQMSIKCIPGISADELAGNYEAGMRFSFYNVSKTTDTIGGRPAVIVTATDPIQTEYYAKNTVITTYFMDADDGSRSVELQYTEESAEGAGARMKYMVESFVPMGF